MKKLIDSYYKLILRLINFLPEEEQDNAKKRLDTCHTCEFRKGERCGVCGCLLAALVMRPDNCEKGKWHDSTNKPNKED